MKVLTYAEFLRLMIRTGWKRPRWQQINLRRKHRCLCRGWAHRIFGTQHECLNMVYGRQRRMYCSSCPCTDNVPRYIGVIPA